MTTKQVTLRLPKDTITRVARIAKLAKVSPTAVYNVFLAAYIDGLAQQSAAEESRKETK